MPNLVYGQDPGGGLRPIAIDENGNLRMDLVSGIAVSTEINSAVTLEVLQVSGSVSSVSIAGVARTTNPTAVADGGAVKASLDDLGRQVITPYQVRDLVATAQAETITLAAVNLLAGAASTLHDLVYLTAANTSGAAVRLDVRDSTGGGVVATLQIPANDSRILNIPVPIPQGVAADTWTITNGGSGDISDTRVVVSALFIKNV